MGVPPTSIHRLGPVFVTDKRHRAPNQQPSSAMHHNGQKDKQRQTKRIDKRFDDLEESAEVPNERLLRGITNVGWHARNLHSVSSIHFRGDDQESTQDLRN